MSDRLNGVSVFVETVEAGGFSAAATRLNLSRSAVGKTIARLETRLGARLFHRTTRSQALTEDGQAYYERCLRALEEIRTGEAMLDSGRREIAGRLRVSAPVLFGRRCVAPILTALARQHPKLELHLNFSDRLVDLREDGFDLAIRNGAPGDGPGLMIRRIGYQRMTVCAAPAYLETHGKPRAIEELAGHDAIAYGRSGYDRNWLFPVEGAPPITVAPRARLRFDDLEAIADAAVAGMGLAWLPCWLIRERVLSGALVRVLDDRPGLVFDTHALWPQTPHLPLRLRLAIDTLAQALPRLVGDRQQSHHNLPTP
jgi:DNA-binding transcriptional LysR family regulator